jgi:hypothetical protein
MSAAVVESWRGGVTSKRFDAWTCNAEGEPEPVGSFATQPEAERAVSAAGRGCVSTGRTVLRCHRNTSDVERAELAAIFPRRAA